KYLAHLEGAYWDIIIIDEAHNVALRGAGKSQRARLAQLLSTRSDTLVMLSATPHDGSSESFASLLNMLDATAIADPSHYAPADFADKGLVIRRFKRHVKDQIDKEFPERDIGFAQAQASPAEEAVYGMMQGMTFRTLDGKKSRGAQLFATTLTKAMFSSPAACASVIRNHLGKLGRSASAGAREDAAKLEGLLRLAEAVGPGDFSKYQLLIRLLGAKGRAGELGWNRGDPCDRLVIFTESVRTLEFLAQNLPRASGLSDKQVIALDGSMGDTEISKAVESFNRSDSPARLLLCSDVASEGINLHHFAHRMIHFDIPWSLMTFQQRNGRIDRYGQTARPQIRYLQTISVSPGIATDARVLERLAE
ncbi:MAG: DEAD/DEAH box helicase, partial [Duodenibacillus sp.]|nr:DEAD/DEAH box helicase [Duodenibacillus sp.]